MNDAIEEPTALSRTWARTVAFFQFIVIGPIAVATTIVHFVTCCCCLPFWIISVPSEVPRSMKNRVVNILSHWLTCWCTIWTSFISMMAYSVFLFLFIVPYMIYLIMRWRLFSTFIHPSPSLKPLDSYLVCVYSCFVPFSSALHSRLLFNYSEHSLALCLLSFLYLLYPTQLPSLYYFNPICQFKHFSAIFPSSLYPVFN